MAYTPINWQTGDTITAEKLNRCDNGWSVTSGTATYFDGSVTVPDGGSEVPLSGVTGDFSSASEITATIDSVAYNLTGFDDGGYWTFGAPYGDFSTYTFSISFGSGATVPNFVAEEAGTYALEIEAVTTTAEISDSFAMAVATAAPLLKIVQQKTTWQQVYDAMAAGKIAYYYFDSGDSAYTYFADSAYFDDSSSRYLVACNGGNMTLSANSASGALMAD